VRVSGGTPDRGQIHHWLPATHRGRTPGHDVPLSRDSLQPGGAGAGGGKASAHPLQIECENVSRASIAATTASGGWNQSPSSWTRPHQAHAITVSPASNAAQTREKTSFEFT